MSGGGGKGGSIGRPMTEKEMKARVMSPGWEAREKMEQQRAERKTAREQQDTERENAVKRTRK